MAIICRLLQLDANEADRVVARETRLESAVQSAKIFSDVYRYWHGMQFLLARHRPGSIAARWLELGLPVSERKGEVPGARVMPPADVFALNAELAKIEPDELASGYDAAGLDQAEIYPRCWVEWEQTFDPLGQMLEHYSFLQSAVRTCAAAGGALLLYFVDDGVND